MSDFKAVVKAIVDKLEANHTPPADMLEGMARLNGAIARYYKRNGLKTMKRVPAAGTAVTEDVASGHIFGNKLEDTLYLMSFAPVKLGIDPDAPGVVVPPEYQGNGDPLCLEFGLDMVVPIDDLHLDHAGISGTLTFSRVPFHCSVPWHAVHAAWNDHGRIVWSNDPQPAA